MVSADFLYYNTPIAELKNHYGDDFEQPFKNKITTQLPKNVVLIRLAAIAVFGALLALSTPAWIWPVVVLGSAAYAGWVIYSHLLQKDPLVEVFYKIVGGKDQYDNLPEIVLAGEKALEENVKDLNWDDLNHSMYRSKTEDGRRILIVKALTRDPEQEWLGGSAQAKTIFAFVEKLGPVDLKVSETSDLSPENSRLFDSFLQGFILTENQNTFGSFSYCSSGDGSSCSIRKHYISASMTSDMANEFFAQMKESVES